MQMGLIEHFAMQDGLRGQLADAHTLEFASGFFGEPPAYPELIAHLHPLSPQTSSRSVLVASTAGLSMPSVRPRLITSAGWLRVGRRRKQSNRCALPLLRGSDQTVLISREYGRTAATCAELVVDRADMAFDRVDRHGKVGGDLFE